MTGTANQNQSLFEKAFHKMCVTIYRKFCSTEGVAAGFVWTEEQYKNSHLCKFVQMAVYRNTFVIYTLRQYPHGRS